MKYHIVAYCSENYKSILRFVVPSWLHDDVQEVHVYTDDWAIPFSDSRIELITLFDKSTDVGVHCSRKAKALQHFCKKHPKTKNIILLDIDCYVIGELLTVFDNDFDIAPTIYDVPHRRRLNNVSSGVLFLKNNMKTRQFIDEWVKRQDGDREQTRCRDQRQLSKLLKKNGLNLNLYCLDYKIFNWHPMTANIGHIKQWKDKICHDCKILHFAFGLWNDIKAREILDGQK